MCMRGTKGDDTNNYVECVEVWWVGTLAYSIKTSMRLV